MDGESACSGKSTAVPTPDRTRGLTPGSLPSLFRREFDQNPLRAASEPQPGGQGVCSMRFGAWPALTRRYARTAGLH
jgi:hypothetical protein